MKSHDIGGFSKSKFDKLKDRIGALGKRIELKRIEPYADIIDEVFQKYNSDDDKRTMMYKLLRYPESGTTTRRKHTENCKEIATELADSFDWLSSDIVRVMARHHDIGHTFLGHSGEWWLSSIKEKYGMPNCVHNAVGARNLSIRYKAQDEIASKIKEKNPKISDRKLRKIKDSMWLIYDAINCHNGEQSEYSYSPDFSKKRNRYEEELVGCYIKKGFDRTLIPATAEGSLMRLTDKISYIPFDMVDIFRNKCNIPNGKVNEQEVNFYEEYSKAFKELGLGDNALNELLSCKTEEEYDEFARRIQKIFIEDVKKNTKRNNIRMSPEMSAIMHRIRNINNKLMVNYVVLGEDHENYVPALEGYMKSVKRFLLNNIIIDPYNIPKSIISQFQGNQEMTKLLFDSFENDFLSRDLAEYIAGINPEDFNFTLETCKKSFEETIKSEIDIARAVTTGAVDAVEIKAQGLKKTRIDSFIKQYQDALDYTYNDSDMAKFMNPFSDNLVENFKRNLWLKKIGEKIKADAMSKLEQGSKEEGIIPLYEMVAMEIGSQYLAQLNDYEWQRVFREYAKPDEATKTSLSRKYTECDFRHDGVAHKDWDNIAALQAKGIEYKDNKKKSYFQKIKEKLSAKKVHENR